MIGREREIKELNKLYENDSAELIAIYGRLGDGKTYLVDAFQEEEKHQTKSLISYTAKSHEE